MKYIIALAIVLSLNMMLFLSQTAISVISPQVNDYGKTPSYFDRDKSILSEFNNGNYTLKDAKDRLPSDTGGVTSDSDNSLLTDEFKSNKNAILDAGKLGFGLNVIGAFPIFLNNMGLPFEFVFAVSSFWYGITLFCLVSWIWGRE
jgi:hypothetical protein